MVGYRPKYKNLLMTFQEQQLIWYFLNKDLIDYTWKR